MISIRETGQWCGYKSGTFELSEVLHHSAIVFAPGPEGENEDMDPEASAGL